MPIQINDFQLLEPQTEAPMNKTMINQLIADLNGSKCLDDEGSFFEVRSDHLQAATSILEQLVRSSESSSVPEEKCSVCGHMAVLAPIQPDMCDDCAHKDCQSGIEDAQAMADNMQKYGTIDKPDELEKIIEAAYHCAHSNVEIHAAINEAGLDQMSDESIAMLLGEYSDQITSSASKGDRSLILFGFRWRFCLCRSCIKNDTQKIGPMDVGYDYNYYCPRHPMYVTVAEWGEELSGEECKPLSEAVKAGLVKRTAANLEK